MALGVTMQLPSDDKHTYTRDFLESQIAIMMGGRLAEELFLGHMTTGAGNDIEQATEMARRMVCDYGMSSLGPLTFGKREEQIFLGREIAQHRDYSEDTAIKIDLEVKRFISEGYEKAKKILEENRDTLARIAEALLEREVLDANEVRMIIQNLPLEEKVEPVSNARPGGQDGRKTQVVQSLTPSVPSLVDKQREKPAPA
jgi:cell division protease FtsH